MISTWAGYGEERFWRFQPSIRIEERCSTRSTNGGPISHDSCGATSVCSVMLLQGPWEFPVIWSGPFIRTQRDCLYYKPVPSSQTMAVLSANAGAGGTLRERMAHYVTWATRGCRT